MKALIFAASLLFSASALAGESAVPKGAISLADIAGQVSVEPLCPKGLTCFAGGTIVNLTFTGFGCLDNVLNPSYTVIGNDVVVHAQVAINEKSPTVMCAAMPMSFQQLTLINVFPPFKVHFLGTDQTVEIK